MPTELELIALNTEFDLYLPFSKRLVLNLPDAKGKWWKLYFTENVKKK